MGKPKSYRPLGRPTSKFEGFDIGLVVTERGHGLGSAGSREEKLAGSSEHCIEI